MSTVSPFNSNIESLRNAIASLESLTQSDKVQAIDLEEKVQTVTTLGKRIITEYSRQQRALEGDEISKLIQEVNEKIQQLNTRLQTSGSTTTGKIQIIFTDIVKKEGVTKQKPIKEKEFIRILTSSLTSLEKNISDMQTFGIVVDHFKKHSSFPEKLAIGRDKFISALFSFLVNKISKKFFLGHQPQIILLQSKQKLEILKKEKIELLDKLNSSPSSKELAKEIKQLQNKIEKVQEEIEKLETDIKLGKETRANLHSIGGTNIKIDIPTEDVTLDGMYISSDSFKATLKEGGAQSYELSFQSISGGEKVHLKGIAFPANTKEGIIDKALTSLGAFSSPDKPGAGWQKLDLKDGTVLLMTDEEVDKLKQLNIIERNGGIDSKKWSIDLNYKELDTSQFSQSGTVLLTSGNIGVYEMHKREILAFLMRGMNVMTFNFRGYGESTGEPSEKGLKRDMEAAYQYLKKTHDISDEKLLVKALCMSGGPAAHLAAKHPNINLFLDQSYANFDAIVSEETEHFIKNFAKEKSLDSPALNSLLAWGTKNSPSLVHTVTKLAAPAWSIEKEIGKVKGHVGILLTKQDDLIDVDTDIYKNYKSALDGRQAQSVSVFAMEGKHGESWLNPPKVDLIKYATLDEAQTMVSEMKKEDKENIDVKNYPLIPKDQIDKKIQQIASKYPDSSITKELELILDNYKKDLESIQKEYTISRFDREKTINEIIGGKTDSAGQSMVKQFLEECTMSSDQLIEAHQLLEAHRLLKAYSVSLLDGDEIDAKLEKIATDSKRDLSSEEEEDLRSRLDTYMAKIQRGKNKKSSLEDIIQDIGEKDPWRNVVKQFVTECTVEHHPFIGIYKAIFEGIQRDSLNPDQIDKVILTIKDSLPKNMQDEFQTFIYKAIQIPSDIISDLNPQQQRYEGRRQMDYFLRRAKLMGSLI